MSGSDGCMPTADETVARMLGTVVRCEPRLPNSFFLSFTTSCAGWQRRGWHMRSRARP